MEAPFKIAEIDHVVFRCRDQAKMLDFYTRLMGLTEERRIAQIGLIQLRAGQSMIDLVPAADKSTDENGRNIDHVCLGVAVTDMHALVQYLKEHRIDLMGEPAQRYGAHGMGMSLYIRDPEGNLIELKQMST